MDMVIVMSMVPSELGKGHTFHTGSFSNLDEVMGTNRFKMLL